MKVSGADDSLLGESRLRRHIEVSEEYESPPLAGFYFSYTIREAMQRTLKHLLYGLLYLGVLVLIAFPFAYPLIFPAPTCVDGIQNQNEEGIDCGGSCENCELKSLRLEVGGVDILQVGEKSSLLVKVKNPSRNFGALRIPYQFEIEGVLGESIKVVEGELNISGGDEKYIAEVGLDIKTSDIGKATFTLGDFKFIDEKNLLEYNVEIENMETSFPGEIVQVKGFITDDSGSTISKIVLTALFYANEGNLVNVGTAVLSNLEAFEKRDFLISVPRNDAFVDVTRTKISWRII